MPPDPPKKGEIYFEYITLGNSTKVSAVDAATGTEVSIMGPAGTDRKTLESLALRKLLMRMSRK